MLLKQIKLINENASRDIHKGIKSELKSKGYKFLGAGSDQLAFKAPDGSVLKIFQSNKTSEKSEGQRMFEEWHEFCQKHKNSHLVPQFLEYKPFVYAGHYYLQIRMERLFPLTKMMQHGFEDTVYAAGRMPAEEFLNYMGGAGKSKQYSFAPEAKAAIAGAIDDMEEFWEIVKELSSIARKNMWILDLHENNAMLDDQGMLVIIDPWWVGNKYY